MAINSRIGHLACLATGSSASWLGQLTEPAAWPRQGAKYVLSRAFVVDIPMTDLLRVSASERCP
ncbi:MAG: hypothetical protein JO100_13385 [Pseudonocardia sp.]|nr:hypothetical protein [Pseudonocardia sp.]